MPDILRVTTPLIDKNQSVAPKAGVEATSAFQLQDPSKVIAAHNQTELMQQNTGSMVGGEAPTLLLNLLKDPAVAVTYLKNIFLLEEIFKLLPANNRPITKEIEQLFHQLLVDSGDITPEMLRQEGASTAFRGELFDFLRNISDGNRSSPEIQLAVANFLKAVNNFMCKDDVLGAVTNSLLFLRENLSASTRLSARLDALIAGFTGEDAAENFQTLKGEALALFRDIEESILFSPKLSKVLSITIYNLSRFNDNLEFFGESIYRMRQLLAGEERGKFMALIDGLAVKLQNGEAAKLLSRPENLDSQVMEALIRLVSAQSEDKSLNAADAAKIDKILHSLLSSPCNFTPLLHFIVPVIQGGMRAFAEIWINPESDEKDMPKGAGKGSHFLLVIDVDGIGRFEAELFVHGDTVDFMLFCPPGYETPYREMVRTLPKALSETPYRLGDTRVEPLNKSRSLMDVFKSLPYKRVGVDVRI